MAFIDRFIKAPIQVYAQTEAELTGKRTYEDTYCYLLPSEICEMFPTNRIEGEIEDGDPLTQIYTKAGRSFVVELPIDAFIDLLNRHFSN